ncbi:MAG: T9SS type A sorting domain-containing protein [Chitinophagales bacterium]
MKVLTTLLLTWTIFLFTNCDNTSPDPDPAISHSTTLEKVIIPEPDDTISDPTTEPTVTLNGSKKTRTDFERELEKKIDKEIERQLAIDPDLPSLSKAAEAYNKLTVKLFTSLSDETGGETFMVDNSKYVVNAIAEIIKTYMTSESDLVFLIDKTGSMSDDIGEIKKSINTIIDQVKPYKNTRIGFAFYGDANADKTLWYNFVNLDSDFEKAKTTVNNIATVGGGDTKESVNDGIVTTINKMNWGEGRRRMILLIGDAPSHEPPMSKYSLNDVLALAKDQDVIMNFYPVVIGFSGKVDGVLKAKEVMVDEKDFILSVAPNPATNYTLVKANEISDYIAEVFDINGKLMSKKNFHDNNCSIMTNELPTGVYVIRLVNNADKSVDTQKFVVRR